MRVCAHQAAFIRPVRTAVLTEAGRPGVPAPSRPSHPLQSERQKSGRKIRNHRPTELGSIDSQINTADQRRSVQHLTSAPAAKNGRCYLFLFLTAAGSDF